MCAKRLVAPLFSLLLFSTVALPAMAQSTGPVQFDITESALAGTVSCNGGAPTTLAPIDASTTDVSGSNDNQASNLVGTACGLPLFSIASADDSSSAQDSVSQDNASGNSTLQNVSWLGGLVTYLSKTEADNCSATEGAASTTIHCSDTTTVHQLRFAGNPITGTFTAPTTFNALNVNVQVPGYCTGVALFTGTLTVSFSSSQVSADGTSASVESAPIKLDGSLTCIGLPLTSIQVHLKDYMASAAVLSQAHSTLIARPNVTPPEVFALLQ